MNKKSSDNNNSTDLNSKKSIMNFKEYNANNIYARNKMEYDLVSHKNNKDDYNQYNINIEILLTCNS